MSFRVYNPVDTLKTSVNDLSPAVVIIDNPVTDAQTVNIAPVNSNTVVKFANTYPTDPSDLSVTINVDVSNAQIGDRLTLIINKQTTTVNGVLRITFGTGFTFTTGGANITPADELLPVFVGDPIGNNKYNGPTFLQNFTFNGTAFQGGTWY